MFVFVVGSARLIGIAAVTVGLGCEAKVISVGAWQQRTGRYLEAETGRLSGGFTIGSDPIASGGRYIEPPLGMLSMSQPGSAHAEYPIDIATPSTYLIWGRIHSPDALHNRFWFQVDDGTWYTWRITTGDVWHWNAFHDDTDYGTPLTFQLDAGSHRLVIANAEDRVQLDALYFTADGDQPLGNYTFCNPPHSIQLDGGCHPSCGSQGGNACNSVSCNNRQAIPAYDCAICCIVPLIGP